MSPANAFETATKPSRFAHFWQGAESLAPATQKHIWTFRNCPSMWCFNILTWKYASRHNGAYFFDISTSKSGPDLVCLVRFAFEVCFAPQRRALFRHLNFQKWPGPGMLCTFWLRNVLRATTACNFSSLIWPAGSAPAALASLLFNPPEPQIIGKTQFRVYPTFSRICIFFLLTLSLLWSSLFFSSLLWLFTPLLFHLSILSEVWLLNFLQLLILLRLRLRLRLLLRLRLRLWHTTIQLFILRLHDYINYTTPYDSIRLYDYTYAYTAIRLYDYTTIHTTIYTTIRLYVCATIRLHDHRTIWPTTPTPTPTSYSYSYSFLLPQVLNY